MSIRSGTDIPQTERDQETNWAEEHREWLEDVAEGDSPADWVADDVLQSLDESREGNS